MIVLSMGLVLVGLVMLLLGVFSVGGEPLTFIYVSIGACLLAAVLLTAGILRSRPAMGGAQATRGATPPPAPERTPPPERPPDQPRSSDPTQVVGLAGPAESGPADQALTTPILSPDRDVGADDGSGTETAEVDADEDEAPPPEADDHALWAPGDQTGPAAPSAPAEDAPPATGAGHTARLDADGGRNAAPPEGPASDVPASEADPREASTPEGPASDVPASDVPAPDPPAPEADPPEASTPPLPGTSGAASFDDDALFAAVLAPAEDVSAVRRGQLRLTFRTVEALRRASVEEIADVQGISIGTASRIHRALHG